MRNMRRKQHRRQSWFGGSGGGIDSGRGRNDAVDVVVAVENGWLFFSFTTIDGC